MKLCRTAPRVSGQWWDNHPWEWCCLAQWTGERMLQGNSCERGVCRWTDNEGGFAKKITDSRVPGCIRRKGAVSLQWGSKVPTSLKTLEMVLARERCRNSGESWSEGVDLRHENRSFGNRSSLLQGNFYCARVPRPTISCMCLLGIPCHVLMSMFFN